MVDSTKVREFLSLAEAANEFGVSQNYLRFLIFKHKLQGVKIGINWVTIREWMQGYFGLLPEMPDALLISQENDIVSRSSGFLYILRLPSSVGRSVEETVLYLLKSDFNRDVSFSFAFIKDGFGISTKSSLYATSPSKSLSR